MTIKEMFKKVETYNEIAELLGNRSAKVYFYTFPHGESFSTYKDLSKYIRSEYLKEMADEILKYNGFKAGETVTIKCITRFGDELELEIEVDITEN